MRLIWTAPAEESLTIEEVRAKLNESRKAMADFSDSFGSRFNSIRGENRTKLNALMAEFAKWDSLYACLVTDSCTDTCPTCGKAQPGDKGECDACQKRKDRS